MSAQNPFGVKVSTRLTRYKNALASKATALDIGCARGSNSFYLASLGLDVDAIDTSADYTGTNPNICFEKTDVRDFAFAKKYDVIVALNILQFLTASDKYAVMDKMLAALKPDGWLFIQSFTEDDPTFLNARPDRSHFKRDELRAWALKNNLQIKSYTEEIVADDHEPIGKHIHGIVSLIAIKE
ncbi:MAG: class I SAM-dependent methyltransferase [Lactobacillales bacterium]|jgi:2-polyprenyl-3-methyl-5-hydroxy-6-metoxy-1,4-benzoquinol methylase|nr:class I SAM-dependent methyltransferase [Lactobacillales bacterium]